MNVTAAKTRRFDRDVDGILLLDKPAGMTSNAALQRARVLYRAIKAGHAGSLDPMATGMLPVCFGQATKVCAFLLDSGKAYRFTARLGERTDTGDADGAVIERRPVVDLTEASIRDALHGSLGQQSQVPPMYSALKHQGRRLYELARQGEVVERAPRHIRIDKLELLRWDAIEVEIRARCSKGTYVRTLAEDLAAKLGTVAHLTALRREYVDPFENRPIHTLDELTAAAGTPDRLNSLLSPADQALPHLPSVRFDAAGRDTLLHGGSAAGLTPAASGETVRMYGPDHAFLGLGQAVPDGRVQPRRLLVTNSP